MNHKLRVLVRVDVDPGRVTLEVTGCLTPSDFPALLHITRRASRLGAGNDVVIDLNAASHLDPEVLLELRSLAAGSAAQGEPFRITLAEPAELPICLLHVGSEGEVLAGLEGELTAVPLQEAAPAIPAGSPADLTAGDASGLAVAAPLDLGLDEANSPNPAGLNTINGLELAEYFEGTLDPAATVRALSDLALGQLADALYRHLDTNNPSFGAHTWYELATEELQNRHLDDADGADGADISGDAAVSGGPAEDELAAGLA
ncbi:hypothetical protein [Pseudarthrobacter sp. 1C304]|uniref:hypothetical protein n=1 Tax=Pseudarthrobacter sp. 1C304 TaxID=3457438 RepID=UPI003FD2FFEF